MSFVLCCNEFSAVLGEKGGDGLCQALPWEQAVLRLFGSWVPHFAQCSHSEARADGWGCLEMSTKPIVPLLQELPPSHPARGRLGTALALMGLAPIQHNSPNTSPDVGAGGLEHWASPQHTDTGQSRAMGSLCNSRSGATFSAPRINH